MTKLHTSIHEEYLYSALVRKKVYAIEVSRRKKNSQNSKPEAIQVQVKESTSSSTSVPKFTILSANNGLTQTGQL